MYYWLFVLYYYIYINFDLPKDTLPFHNLNDDEKLHIEENPNYLSFLHLNVRSLSRNFGPLSNFLGYIDNNFSVIGLSETWLQHSENDVELPGFNFIHNHRYNRTGGGVGLYFSTDLNYKVRNDLNYNDITCAESLCIEIIKPRGEKDYCWRCLSTSCSRC